MLKEILKHVKEQFPKEACGLILDNKHGTVIIPCENISETPERAFLIDPLVYAAYSDRITAVYHSHPGRSPEPSMADIASAERCNLPFMIISYPSEEIFTYTPDGRLPAPYEGRYFIYGVLDCLSLVADYYKFELAIKLPAGTRKQWHWWFDETNYTAFIDGFKEAGFVEVKEPKKNDLIIMTTGNFPCPNHAAIYLGDNLILHHAGTESPSRIESYGQFWRQSTNCFLHYEDKE